MLIPLPKIIVWGNGKLTLKAGRSPKIALCPFDDEDKATVNVIRHELKDIFKGYGGCRISLEWAEKLVVAEHVPTQAFVLDITRDGICIQSNKAAGALYAVETLRQLFEKEGELPLVHIHDWPDVAERIAARLTLCAEACRNALDWGDGIDGFERRMKEQIDFLLRYKANAMDVWGFSWKTKQFKGFGKCWRSLNAYARARNVRLMFGGFGLSAHDPGHERILAEADRLTSGLGCAYKQTYPCSMVDPKQKPGVYCGTCRSNQALRAQKVKDLAAFVKTVEPGMLYIHHEDLNTIKETQEYFWDKRCAECRKKWPDDNVEAYYGGSGAIADTLNLYSEALESLPPSRTGYVASHDCLIAAASPGYGDWKESDEDWTRIKMLWLNVARQLKHPEHFLFCLREQFRNESDGNFRIHELLDDFKREGLACGIKNAVVGGADMYYNDAPFTAVPEMYEACAFVQCIFGFSGYLFQKPLEAFMSECMWNTTPRAGGCIRPLPKSSVDCNNLLKRYAYPGNGFIPESYAEPDSWLARACAALYGKKAGKWMHEYQLLRSQNGLFPLSILYYETSMRRKIFRIIDNPATDYAKEADYWEEKCRITIDGLELITKAIKGLEMTSDEIMQGLLDELVHQRQCLKLGIAFANVARLWYAKEFEACTKALRVYEKQALAFPRNFIGPNQGDAELYLQYAEEFHKRLKALKPLDN